MPGYIMGIDPTKVRTSTEGREFKLGQMGATVDTAGNVREYRYVTSVAGVTGAGYVCQISAAHAATMVTTTTTAPGTGQGLEIGVGVAAIAANGFGWVQVEGPCSVRVAASAAAHTQLNSTATAGVVDDDATAGAEVMTGLIITTANGGAEATGVGIIHRGGHVGRTL